MAFYANDENIPFRFVLRLAEVKLTVKFSAGCALTTTKWPNQRKSRTNPNQSVAATATRTRPNLLMTPPGNIKLWGYFSTIEHEVLTFIYSIYSLAAIKRQRTEDYTLSHSANRSSTSSNNYRWACVWKLSFVSQYPSWLILLPSLCSLDSAYNEHLLTIGQLQYDIKALKRQLAQKDAELLAKDKIIAGLKSDLDDYETQQRERSVKSQHMTNEEISKLKVRILFLIKYALIGILFVTLMFKRFTIRHAPCLMHL